MNIFSQTGIGSRFLEQLINYCSHQEEIEKVILFGSRGRGDYKKTSDIDLAIFTKPCSHSQQNVITDTIDQMDTLLKIDIIFFDRLSKQQLKKNILKEGFPLYERKKKARLYEKLDDYKRATKRLNEAVKIT